MYARKKLKRQRLPFADHPGAPGASDREPAAPVGPPHHLHRAHQEPLLQVLAARVRHLRPRDPEALRVGRQVVHGAAAARPAAGKLHVCFLFNIQINYRVIQMP